MGRGRTEEQWEEHKFPLEGKLQAYAMTRLNKCEGIKPSNISDRVNGGISDLILCVNGKFVAIELKVGSNTPTALQLDFLKGVKESGGIGGVAYTWGQIKNIISLAGYSWD